MSSVPHRSRDCRSRRAHADHAVPKQHLDGLAVRAYPRTRAGACVRPLSRICEPQEHPPSGVHGGEAGVRLVRRGAPELTVTSLCMQVRAAALSGDCDLTAEFARGVYKWRDHHRICVRRRAVKSVAAHPSCASEEEVSELQGQPRPPTCRWWVARKAWTAVSGCHLAWGLIVWPFSGNLIRPLEQTGIAYFSSDCTVNEAQDSFQPLDQTRPADPPTQVARSAC